MVGGKHSHLQEIREDRECHGLLHCAPYKTSGETHQLRRAAHSSVCSPFSSRQPWTNTHLPKPLYLFAVRVVMSVDCIAFPVIDVDVLHAAQHQLQRQSQTECKHNKSYSRSVFRFPIWTSLSSLPPTLSRQSIGAIATAQLHWSHPRTPWSGPPLLSWISIRSSTCAKTSRPLLETLPGTSFFWYHLECSGCLFIFALGWTFLLWRKHDCFAFSSWHNISPDTYVMYSSLFSSVTGISAPPALSSWFSTLPSFSKSAANVISKLHSSMSLSLKNKRIHRVRNCLKTSVVLLFFPGHFQHQKTPCARGDGKDSMRRQSRRKLCAPWIDSFWKIQGLLSVSHSGKHRFFNLSENSSPYPNQRVVEFRIYRLEIIDGQLFVEHPLVEWHRESTVDELPVVQRLQRPTKTSSTFFWSFLFQWKNSFGNHDGSTYHGDESTDESEVHEMIRVDGRGRVNLQAIVVVVGIFKQTVHRVQDLVWQVKEPLPAKDQHQSVRTMTKIYPPEGGTVMRFLNHKTCLKKNYLARPP